MSQKITSIQNGLLRFNNKDEKISLQVEVKKHNIPGILNVAVKDGVYSGKFFNRAASIIQKTGNGYLFISGYITNERKTENPILSLNVLKAQLFVRKADGRTSWLEEASTYEQMEKNHELIL